MHFLYLIIIGFFFSACSFTTPDTEKENIPISYENALTATFAGGCFWCMEPAFQEREGVISTTVGYAGGNKDDANYKAVSEGKTKHREAIQVLYDPAMVSYEELVHIFLGEIRNFIKCVY